jgi:hypothetical protein
MDFREVGFEGVNSIELAQDRDFLRFLWWIQIPKRQGIHWPTE